MKTHDKFMKEVIEESKESTLAEKTHNALQEKAE